MRKEKKKAIREEDENEEETETMDIYNEKQLEQMLENDEITEAEYSFMLGREKVRKQKSLGLERKEPVKSTKKHILPLIKGGNDENSTLETKHIYCICLRVLGDNGR